MRFADKVLKSLQYSYDFLMVYRRPLIGFGISMFYDCVKLK